MCNELKVGQRIEVYESLPSEHLNSPFPAGMQRCLIEKIGGMFIFNCFFLGEPCRQHMMEYEVKKIGAFVIKRLHNTHPETII